MVVCEWELGEARRKDAIDRARVRGEQPPAELLAEERGLHSSIETDVRNFLEGQSYKELVALQTQIESDMRSGKAKVVEFWEVVIKRLHIYKAKVCICTSKLSANCICFEFSLRFVKSLLIGKQLQL